VINKKAWEWPPIFKYLQELGNISEEEMYRVFNCGIGLVLIVKKDDEPKIKELLSACGEKCYTLGWVDRVNAGEERVVFVEG
jgi:phosphoribosylformylglycinamidine cyclo-ligase